MKITAAQAEVVQDIAGYYKKAVTLSQRKGDSSIRIYYGRCWYKIDEDGMWENGSPGKVKLMKLLS